MDSEKSEENESEKNLESDNSVLEKTSTPIQSEKSQEKIENFGEKQTENDLDGFLFSAPGMFLII